MIILNPFHTSAAISQLDPGAVIGNPLYDVLSGHGAAILAVLVLPLLAWWLGIRARDGSRRAGRLVAGYSTLGPLDRLAIWTMAASAAIHAVLAPGHDGAAMAILFLGQATLLLVAIVRAASGRSWRTLGGLVLIGSIVAYAIAVTNGDLVDQVGLATKFIELVGLAAIARGATAGRPIRRLATVSGLTALVLLTSIAGWSGSVLASGGHGAADAATVGVEEDGHGGGDGADGDEHRDGADGDGHEDGADGDGHRGGHGHGHGALTGYPTPGSVMATGLPAEATPAQRAAAEDLHARIVAATARYADPAVAAADGYAVGGIEGTDFHAANPAYEDDGRILDPERPEDLIYAATPNGPVLLGVMFSMPDDEPGPMIGGPTTVWHAHEHVCFGLVPPGLAGLLSPLGGCPVGAVDLPLTNEMIHAWVVPGAPQSWGDLDEAWRDRYLAGLGATP